MPISVTNVISGKGTIKNFIGDSLFFPQTYMFLNFTTKHHNPLLLNSILH